MSYVTLSGTDGIIENITSLYEKQLKPAYENLKPSIKSAQEAIKAARAGGTAKPTGDAVETPSPSAPPPQVYDPSRRGGDGVLDSVPSWAIYAGIGAVVLGFFFFRSK